MTTCGLMCETISKLKTCEIWISLNNLHKSCDFLMIMLQTMVCDICSLNSNFLKIFHLKSWNYMVGPNGMLKGYIHFSSHKLVSRVQFSPRFCKTCTAHPTTCMRGRIWSKQSESGATSARAGGFSICKLVLQRICIAELLLPLWPFCKKDPEAAISCFPPQQEQTEKLAA
jgi:hypothetical protein